MKIIIAAILLSSTLSVHALELTLKCQSVMKASGVATLTYESFKLSNDNAGATSQMFNQNLGFDQNNSVLVSLNHTGNVCAENNCDEVVAKTYTLSLVRFENPVRKAAQLKADHKEKVKGDSSATIELTQMNSGELTATYFQDGELQYNKKRLPKNIEVNYSVSRGFLKKRQNIQFACDIKIKK
jgi:hypothetical protein